MERYARALLGVGWVAAGAHPGLPRDCSTILTRIAPSGIGNRVIGTVTVKAEAPAVPFANSWIGNLRRTTESEVVRRQLRFAPGDRVDSTRIAESLRRLRDQRLYADVTLSVTQCVGSDTVDFTITTRDTWTLRPVARVVPPATVSIGVEDRNVLGSGRALAVANDQSARGHGGSAALTDPWVGGTDVLAGVRYADIAGAHLLRGFVRHRELGDFDPWRVEAAFGRQRYANVGTDERPLGTLYLMGNVGHLVGSTASTFTVPYAGVSYDHAHVMAAMNDSTGLTVRRRNFIGANFGVLRRAARFDTLGWLASGRGFLDIPLGLESDVMVAPGIDRGQRATALRYDAWLGRMWLPREGQIWMTDLWTSGFAGNVRLNQLTRAAASGYINGWRGFWDGRVLFEQMGEIDPDQRVLSLATIATDPSFSAVPQATRLARRALVSSVERSFHLTPVGRISMLDGALFAAGSLRWDSPGVASDKFSVAVVGARLRLFSTNGSVGSTRVDVAFPVASHGSIVHRPLFSVSLVPLFDLPRLRDSRRRQQQ